MTATDNISEGISADRAAKRAARKATTEEIAKAAASAELPRMLTEEQVCALVGFSRVAIWKKRRRGEFPEPTIFFGRYLRWPEPVIVRFVAEQQAKGRYVEEQRAKATR